MSDDKVVGFRVPKNDEKRLKMDLARQELKRKEWLDKYLTISEGMDELSVKQNEKWLRVPALEYESLLVNSPHHYNIIYQRILQHVISDGNTITFDNLFREIRIFMKMNQMDFVRFDDDGLETIHMEHGVGINYSNFCINIITKMIDNTTQYKLHHYDVKEFSLTIKIEKLTS
jgi:hypothetical protein